MSDANLISPLELGHHLMQIRERAGIKQAELARKVTWSQAVLSRVESGERQLASDELEQLLTVIGTSDARSLASALARAWQVLPRPPLDHPDQDLLWGAEETAQELMTLHAHPDVRNAFQRRLSEYVSELKGGAALLLKREHQIAFIGSIGIGKSTAICRLAALEVVQADSPQPAPVLEVGAGGITICEVHLRSGPQFGLLIEPRGDSEIRADVTDFAEYIRGGDGATPGDDETQGISKEVERAIRNLAGLKIRRDKGIDGKTVRRDEAKQLASNHESTRELVVEILARMELHRRDRRDIWYDAASGKPPLDWLKEMFEKVNNGRHPEFTLPRRMEVVVPSPLLRVDDLSIRFIDTKGIDRTAARADLEGYLGDPHTLTILCSGFNDAPAAGARLLLERAREVGVTGIVDRAALLVLPRPDEALAVKDDSGERVESAEEGYELKGEQVAQSLQPMGLHSLKVGFFNSYADDPSTLKSFLSERVLLTRSIFREKLSAITQNARKLLANYEQEQVHAVAKQAAAQLIAWISLNEQVKPMHIRVHDSLLQQIALAYAATVRATVVREGDWHNLNYGHHLGHGARRLAVHALGAAVDGFSQVCQTMIATPDFHEAAEMISQADRVLRMQYEELLVKVQIMGQTSFRDELKLDKALWSVCFNEWGRGPGYKDRVTKHSRDWFANEQRAELETELVSMIDREWKLALSRITALVELD